jgi:hypothetical protein
MKRYMILVFLSISQFVICDDPKPLSPVQEVLVSGEEHSDDMIPPKEAFVEKVAKALLVHKENPTADNNEKIYEILKKARRCHENIATDAEWLKLVASTHEKKSINAQIALEAHRQMHGHFSFNYPYLTKWWIWGIGGLFLGIASTIVYANNA